MKGKAALIARFKPLHLGSALMLDAACSSYDYVYIGIGSSNKPLSAVNPFTPTESKNMVDIFLRGSGHANYEVFFMPDYAHLGPEHRDGAAWKTHLTDLLNEKGGVDYFVTGNSWVGNILQPPYNIIHPSALINSGYHAPIKASFVRLEIASNGDWRSLVPSCIGDYISENSLDSRLRETFGEEIILTQSKRPDTMQEEMEKTYR